MSVRTVSLSEDAYALLSSLKRPGESFSDVVRRVAATSRSPMEFAGAWKDYPPERLRLFEEWLRWSDRSSIEEQRRPGSAARR